MAAPFSDVALQVLFGKAFLLELERGDLETAKVFARAFLVHTFPVPKCPISVPVAA